MSAVNPFAALITANNEGSDTKKAPEPNENTRQFHRVLEQIFGFTLDESSKQFLYLEEVSKNFKQSELDLNLLPHALFDRLFMCDEENPVIKQSKVRFSAVNSHCCETKVALYLYNCYRNAQEETALSEEDKRKVVALILQNIVTAFVQSDIYQGQNLGEQLLEVLLDASPYYEMFFKDICKGLVEEEDAGEPLLKEKLTEILMLLAGQINKFNVIVFNYGVFNVLNLFTHEEYLASVLLDAKPTKFTSGADFTQTPLGAIFNISILPKHPNGIYEHFQDPTDQASTMSAEGILWSNVDKLTHQTQLFLLNLLRCSPQIKNKTLEWLGLCLQQNCDRKKLWNAQTPPELSAANYTSVSDGFMVNCANVLLRLCQPFCANFNDRKILKVDPTYSVVAKELCSEKGVHLPEMHKETCLVPKENESEILPIADKYNFITDCFYLAHRAVDLGFQVTVDKLVRLNHEVGRIERAYVDAVAQSTNSDFVDSLKKQMTQQLTKYLSIKAQLSDPVLLNMLFDFVSASCYWLSQVAVHNLDQSSKPETFAPLNEIAVEFPLPNLVPNTLKCIPEFLVENTVCYLVFLKRFTPKMYEEKGYEKMKPVLTFILTFMGAPERMKNPHMRASLAEALESLLPIHELPMPGFNALGSYQRESLFTQHEHRSQIVGNLMSVFVSIEMTGQSVEFEQKFNYRRPMYVIMDYLWTKDEYKTHFKALADVAEKTMEAVTPPLFLRFINLLMNDAVYLLDEALSNMAKLREMQTARENGDWNSLPAQERAQNVSYMQHIGMLAKFDNILGRDTIKTLEQLTSEIKIVFTHATMVDRVAAMLNYFLYNLVGPNKKNFKVKDQKEYSFEPATTVLNICRIYVNFKDNAAFCLAVSQDGRSYSPQLFELAEEVLIRIGGGALIGELNEVAAKVAQKAQEQKDCEEAMAEAPEHFLDPIMSTLMTDPVILPSSKQTVDRTTIARHLLSDQTDPFNRAPLSMDQVIPNVELAAEMRKWLQERKK